jgi:ABC-2 type transport system permease protein
MEMDATLTAPAPSVSVRRTWRGRLGALATLVGRRFSLTAHTPREIFVPLLTPILFALVIAPALAKTVGKFQPGIDYMTFVAIATAGLLIPINTMFSGIGVIVDRESGARRDMLAAPIPRPLVVFGNLAVAFAITTLQVVVLVVAAMLRGADFHTSSTGIALFVGGASLLAVGMYGVAETLANRVPKVEEYIAAVPAIAIVPFFFAGSLFPVSALPQGLAWFARFLPLTHAIALMRYGLVDRAGVGLHDIWGMSNPTVMAALSLAVLAAFAAAFTVISIRVFRKAAVQ